MHKNGQSNNSKTLSCISSSAGYVRHISDFRKRHLSTCAAPRPTFRRRCAAALIGTLAGLFPPQTAQVRLADSAFGSSWVASAIAALRHELIKLSSVLCGTQAIEEDLKLFFLIF